MSQVDDTRLIPLTQGKFAIVDAVDYERLNQWRWHAQHTREGNWYAARHIRRDGKCIAIQMHNLVRVPGDGLEIDHINRDGLDNRRANLREATRSQNCANVRYRSKSGYRGVHASGSKWAAVIREPKGRLIHIGVFSDIQDAARAWDDRAREIHGEFASLNFPK